MESTSRTPQRPGSSDLSESQRRAFDLIRDLIDQKGYPPTMTELAESLGITPPSAFEQVEILVRKGFIRKEPGKARGLVIARELAPGVARMIPVPHVGRISAGRPLLAEQNIVGEVLVEERVAARGQCFALTVQGESMIGAGIRPGDLVIVRRQPLAESGDIVVALLGDEATVKRLSIQGDRIDLRPENPKMHAIPVRPDDQFQILGKVVAIRSIERKVPVRKTKLRSVARKEGKPNKR